jgi:hypothetical protein
LDDVSNLLQSRNARRPGRLGDPRFLGRKIEVFGIRIGDTRLIPGLSRKPCEEALESGQSGIKGCLAQRLTAPIAPLLSKVSLERPGLLDVEGLKSLQRVKVSNRAIALATASMVGSL